jgi:hypothetical protein
MTRPRDGAPAADARNALSDEGLRDAHERSLIAQDRPTSTSRLALDRLQALVSREGTEADRLRALDIAMSTAEGRREYEVAWAAARAAQAAESRRAPLTTRRWIAAAASLVIVAGTSYVVTGRNTPPESPDASAQQTMRGTSNGITLITPLATMRDVRAGHFSWRAVAGTNGYTMVLVGEQGEEVFATSTRDTSIVLPDSIVLAAGGTYLWWVEAQLTDGGSAKAVTQRFTVRPDAK